jgi:hypothetical protein
VDRAEGQTVLSLYVTNVTRSTHIQRPFAGFAGYAAKRLPSHQPRAMRPCLADCEPRCLGAPTEGFHAWVDAPVPVKIATSSSLSCRNSVRASANICRISALSALSRSGRFIRTIQDLAMRSVSATAMPPLLTAHVGPAPRQTDYLATGTRGARGPAGSGPRPIPTYLQTMATMSLGSIASQATLPTSWTSEGWVATLRRSADSSGPNT